MRWQCQADNRQALPASVYPPTEDAANARCREVGEWAGGSGDALACEGCLKRSASVMVFDQGFNSSFVADGGAAVPARRPE
jgi:hypothetical protein